MLLMQCSHIGAVSSAAAEAELQQYCNNNCSHTVNGNKCSTIAAGLLLLLKKCRYDNAAALLQLYLCSFNYVTAVLILQ